MTQHSELALRSATELAEAIAARGASIGLPSASFPAGSTADAGLPVGLQVIGPRFGDLAIARFGRLLEIVFGGHVPPPMAQ